MKIILRSTLQALSLMTMATTLVVAQSAPPAIFYSDLNSGSNVGGENNKGAYVTIHGKHLGTAQGTSFVSVGAGKAAVYKVWSDSKVSFQLGPAATTGNITVTSSNGTSNALPFTVRPGNIYFVSTAGDDGGNGSFSAPWSTIPHAASAMKAGDITYVRQGVNANGDDGYGSPLNLSGNGGSAGSPIALVVYPGESAAIGGSGNLRGLIQYPTASPYWTIAGFTMNFSGSSEAIHLYAGTSHWRLIGNNISCPGGGGSTGCVTSDGAPFVDFLGNTIHDTGCPGSMSASGCSDTQKTYHAFYFGDLSGTLNHDINVGWNDVHNVYGCRAIQFHSKDSSPGYEAYGLQVHDNLIYNVRCDAINLANVNPDKGAISVYNNVMYHVGTGPDPSGQEANYTCINTNDTNGNPSTAVEVFNNTCYDGGSRGASEGDAGAYSVFIPTRLRNNVTYQLPGEAYITASSAGQCGNCLLGSNNLWFGLSGTPSGVTANLSVDPLFTNASGHDFHLQSSSPAIDVGVQIRTLLADFDGIRRPQGKGYDVGAYEYFKGSGPTSAGACDLNSDGQENNSDVQIALDQILGSIACGSADLQQNGTCNAADLQRIVNATLGQSCRTGS